MFALALLAPLSARADKKAEAKEHFAKAEEAHKDGRYDDALTELNIAYTLDPQPELLYAIGQVHVMKGECVEAIPFYQRFLDSNPSDAATTKTKEAIETCKRLQPGEKVRTEKVYITVPGKTTTVTKETSPWYTDALGDTFLILGLGAGGAAGWFYSQALSDRTHADQVTSYAEYDSLLKTAQNKQLYSIIAAGAGGALVTIAIITYAVRDRTHERRTVAVVPTSDGAMVTWGGHL